MLPVIAGVTVQARYSCIHKSTHPPNVPNNFFRGQNVLSPAGASIRSGMFRGVSGEAIRDACVAVCPCSAGPPIQMLRLPAMGQSPSPRFRLQYPHDRIIITPASSPIFLQKYLLSGTGIWTSLCMGAIFLLYSVWIFFQVHGYGFSRCIYI